MRSLKIILCFLSLVNLCTRQISSQTPERAKRIVIAATVLLDGKGQVLRNTRIVIEGVKIVAIDSKAGPVDYDLRGLTVMPGWIDAHSHITWSFGQDGKNAGMNEKTQEAAYQSAANAWLTLMAGFTTVQNPGSLTDIPLRDAIAQGTIPGPRILTSAEPLIGRGEQSGTSEEIRAFVRKQKEAGADLIKILASGGFSGGVTLSPEQLNAACGEAKKQGLRTLVHANKDGVRAAALAGCTQVEHGRLATDEELKLMAEKGTYFDPQVGLLLETYRVNKDKYAGSPFFSKNPETFVALSEKHLPLDRDLMQRAVKTPGLKIVFGTDAVAGAHGRNAEEFIYRVRDGGQGAMQALVSANSLGAEALGMTDQIGSIAVGLQADIIALDGDPLKDITSVRRVAFVMKGGVVYKNAVSSKN